MSRLLIVALALTLAAAGCGRFSSGEAEPEAPVAIGSDVDLGDDPQGGAQPDTSGAGSPEGSAAAAPRAAPAAPVEPSHHPRAPSGELMRNVTVREVDGLVLQLSVTEFDNEPGSLLFDLLVVNERDSALFFDPTYADAIVITDSEGHRLWSVGACELRADSDYGHPTLKSGDDTQLTFRYSGDGDGNPSCVLPPGDYDAVANFAWCHPDRHDGKECRELHASQGHPLRIRFADG